MADKKKIIWVYIISAIFVALNIFLIIKNFYWFSLLPVVLILLLLFFFALDKVLYIITFITPLAINIENFEDQLALSLPSEPLLFGVLLVFLLKIFIERNYEYQILKHPVTLAILFYLFWMFITTLTSQIPIVSLKFFIAKLWFIVPFYFVVLLLLKDFNKIKLLSWLYVAPLCIVIIYSTIRLYTWSFDEKAAHWVMDPFYNDHTAYGAAIALFIPVFVGFLFDKQYKNISKLFAVIMLFMLILGIILSFSRAAWISVMVAAVVAIIMFFKIKFRWVFLMLGVLLFLFFYFQDEILWKLEKNKQDSSADLVEHVQSISNISSDASNLERINRWQSALRMFREKPFWGWGPGTYQFIYAPFQKTKEKTIISTNAGDKGTAHSEYIGPLSESGILGLVSVLAIFITVSYTAVKIYRRTKNSQIKLLSMVYFLGLITYFVHGALNNFLDTDKLSVPFWTFIASIVALDLYHKNENSVAVDANSSQSESK